MKCSNSFGARVAVASGALFLAVAACGTEEDPTGADVSFDATEDARSELDGLIEIEEDTSHDTGGAPDVAVDSTDIDAEGQLCGPGNGDRETCPQPEYACIWREGHPGGCEGAYDGVCERVPTSCPDAQPEERVCSIFPGCAAIFPSECHARARRFDLGLAAWPCVGVPCEYQAETSNCPPEVECISTESACDDGWTDGTCQYAPTSCDPATPDNARCACDGTRYDSECHARLAGYFGTLTVCEGSGA